MKPTPQMAKYIHTAAQIEKDGLKFYRSALKKVNDPNSRGLLQWLVKEETEHLAYFQKLAKQLAIGEKVRRMKRAKTPLFKKADYRKVGSKRAQTVGIFDKALELEERGMQFYNRMAKSAKDPELRKFLKDLGKMEQRHFKLIKEHQQAIYDAWYWEAMDMPALNT